jgi:hypothetical protein
VVVRHVGYTGYLEVGQADGGRRQTIFSSSACCSGVVWASRRLIAFDQNVTVKTIDVRTRRVRSIAGADDFKISSDGRWIAWWKDGGEFTPPNPAGIVSITGNDCLVVRTPKNAADMLLYFHPGNTRRVYFLREFDDGTSRTLSLPTSSLKRAPKCSCFNYGPGTCPY